VGSNGLIQSAAVNAPRFDHDPVTLASRGLLIEESRTNICRYSGELVSGTGWTTVGMLSVVDGVGPDGNNAYELSETSGGTFHTFLNTGGTGSSQVASITSGVTYTGSIFLKKITGSVDWVQVTLASAGFGVSQYVNIDISNGTIGNSSGGTARVEQYANGWYRVSWTATATTTTTTSGTMLVAGIQNTNGTTRVPSYSGVGTNKFLAAMAQLEAGSFPTSYIPTVASSVVRSADVCSITGANFTGFYNNDQGTMVTVASANGLNPSLINAVAGIESGATPVMRVFYRAAQGNRLSAQISGVISTPASNYNTANVVYKSAITAGATGADYVIDGTQIPDTYTGSVLTADNLKFTGMSGSSSNTTISSFRYYSKRLPNAKLVTLTT
jgi:hypothetical protein